jgi:hypothetical protein
VPGYPIRTPSDHSLVDNSPRTIVASHVLHRLLMPRHPPCALQHFNNTKLQTTKPDTTRCSHPLCNTQHTTTPPTHPQPPPRSLTNALDGPGQGTADQRKPPDNRMSPQDPTACRTRFSHTNMRKNFWSVFHPATPPTCQGCGNNKKETRDTMPPVCPPIRGSSLERR